MVVQIHNVTTMHATARAKCYFDPRRGTGSIPIEVIDSVSPIPNVPRVLGASIVAEEQIINANGIQSIISAPNYVLGAIIREVD